MSSKITFFLLLKLLIFFSGISLAVGQSSISEKHLAILDKDISLLKLIIHFQDDVDNLKKINLLNSTGNYFENEKLIEVTPSGITICHLHGISNYRELNSLIHQLKILPEILAVNPIIKTVTGDEFGVLNEILVKLKNENDYPVLAEKSRKFHITEIEKSKFLKNVFILKPAKNTALNVLELAILLNETGLFEYAEPDYLFSPFVCTNDPLYKRQWNLLNDGSAIQYNGTPGADMSVIDAWTITTGDSSIKVAVLDSGVDTLHPDLSGKLLPGFDATGNGSKGFPNSAFPEDGHGTACSGIIAAIPNNAQGIAGVAHGCRVIPVRIFYYVDTLGLGVIPYSTSQWMADGISWAAQTAQADVMSNSWGVPDFLFQLLSGPTSVVDDAINDAVFNGRNGKGIPQLFSSGNDNGPLLWPSRLENTIAVSATSMCDERKSPDSCDEEDWGGNYGTGIDVGAPGVKIPATDFTGNRGYSPSNYMNDFNGTSAACPNAAAVVALMLSVRPDLTIWDVRYILGNSADKVGGYAYDSVKYAGSWSRELGFGRVNAHRAVQDALAYTSVNEMHNSTGALDVFPNPLNAESLTIKSATPFSGDVIIEIVNMNGVKLFEQKERQENGNHEIQLHFAKEKFPSGVYVLRLRMNENVEHKKIVITAR